MFVFYQPETGFIQQVFTLHAVAPTDVDAPEDMRVREILPEELDGEIATETWRLHDFYWIDGEGTLSKRAAFDVPVEIALTVGDIRTFDVPPGTVMTFAGETYDLADGKLELEGEMPFAYDIELAARGYVTTTVRVVVSEAAR